jgi:hypothetical protein
MRSFEQLLPDDDEAILAEYRRIKRAEDLLQPDKGAVDTSSGADAAPAPAPSPSSPEPAVTPASSAPAPDTAAAEAMISLMLKDDPFLEFPPWAAAEWSLDDIQAFFDSCGEWQPSRLTTKN